MNHLVKNEAMHNYYMKVIHKLVIIEFSVYDFFFLKCGSSQKLYT